MRKRISPKRAPVTNEQLRAEAEAMEARGEIPTSSALAQRFGVTRNVVKIRLREMEWWTPERRQAAADVGRIHARAAAQARAGAVEDRFWRHVERDADDECWLWTGSRDAKGYGHFRGPSDKEYRASRFSWMLAHGPIPPGMHVCHHCDTPPCVNPAHLFLGTNADNVRDKTAKGRQYHPYAMRNPKRVLSPTDVDTIRTLFAARTLTAMQLARAFEISDSHVYRIVNGGSWTSPT